jgi:hypothetical protein
MHGQGTIQIKLPSISTSEEAFECSAEVALFECRMGIRSTAKELFLTAGLAKSDKHVAASKCGICIPKVP